MEELTVEDILDAARPTLPLTALRHLKAKDAEAYATELPRRVSWLVRQGRRDWVDCELSALGEELLILPTMMRLEAYKVRELLGMLGTMDAMLERSFEVAEVLSIVETKRLADEALEMLTSFPSSPQATKVGRLLVEYINRNPYRGPRGFRRRIHRLQRTVPKLAITRSPTAYRRGLTGTFERAGDRLEQLFTPTS